MIVESDYRGFRIEAVAIEAQGGWDAEVRIRRIPSETRARVERLICRRPTAKVAEQRAVVRARQSVDALIAAGSVSASAGSVSAGAGSVSTSAGSVSAGV